MAKNDFLPWGDSAGTMMALADYEQDAQRTGGVTAGLADPALHNRLYRQATIMAAALGQLIADSGMDATDDNLADLSAAIGRVLARWTGGVFTGPLTIQNSTHFPTLHFLLSDGSSGKNGGRVELSNSGSINLQAQDDATDDANRRILRVWTETAHALDEAVELSVFKDGKESKYQVYHSGRTIPADRVPEAMPKRGGAFTGAVSFAQGLTSQKPLDMASGGLGASTPEGGRAALDIQEWRAGDVFSLTWGVYLGGIVTSGGKECAITVPLGAPIRAKSVAVAGNVILRGNQGYLDNMDSGKGIPLSGGDFTGTAQIVSAKAGLVKISIKKESAAFGNVGNNTPIMMGTATTPQLTLTFS